MESQLPMESQQQPNKKNHIVAVMRDEEIFKLKFNLAKKINVKQVPPNIQVINYLHDRESAPQNPAQVTLSNLSNIKRAEKKWSGKAGVTFPCIKSQVSGTCRDIKTPISSLTEEIFEDMGESQYYLQKPLKNVCTPTRRVRMFPMQLLTLKEEKIMEDIERTKNPTPSKWLDLYKEVEKFSNYYKKSQIPSLPPVDPQSFKKPRLDLKK